MFRLRISSATGLAFLALCAPPSIGCSSGGPGDLDDSTSTSGQSGSNQTGSGQPSSGSADKAAPAATGATADKSSTVGPKCTSYLACCDSMTNAAMAGACDSTRTQLESAQGKGVSTGSFESACAQALESMKTANLCQ